MSYAKSLKNALKDKNQELFGRLEQIRNVAASVLNYTQLKFPHYTPHDFFLHSQNVEEILNWLVPDDVKSGMSDVELFFLLIAAWLHDWGMVASEKENPEEVRATHHIRTEIFFEDLHDKVFLGLNEARAIGRICRGHRQENLHDPKYDDIFFGSNCLVRIRFLSALLKIADECDVTANRTPEVIYYSIKPEGASKEEFQKHLNISGIGKLNPYKLQINGIAWTPRGAEVIEKVRMKIQTELDSVKTILAHHGVALDLVETQIDIRGFINKPIEFSLDRQNIVKLLIGSSLYAGADAAIREFLQNAIDACRVRKVLNEHFVPEIELEFDKGKLVFCDNGVGMNFDDAANYFSRKGQSYYASKDFMAIIEGKEFDPISKFGIGILSAFLIADKILVETKKENCAPCRFTITNLAEGWTYEGGSRNETGTQITLFLNDEGEKLNILDSIQHYAKKVEFPIFLKNAETGERKRLQPEWDYNVTEVLESVSEIQRDSYSQDKPLLVLNINTPEIEADFFVFRRDYSFDKNNCVLANHGVYVGRFNFFQTRYAKWVALVNCKTNVVDLKVSREDIVENQRYFAFIMKLYTNLFKAIEQYAESKFGKTMDILKKSAKISAISKVFWGDPLVKKDSPMFKGLSHLTLTRTYPVLSKGGINFLSGEQIKIQKFKEKMHYPLPVKMYAEHIESAKGILIPKIAEKEAVVFDFGPFFRVQESESAPMECGFCVSLDSEGCNSKCSNLNGIFATHSFERKATPIDCLLPESSFFASMPPLFRGVVVEAEPFVFKAKNQDASMSSFIYGALIAGELLDSDPELKKYYYSPSLWHHLHESHQLVKQGKFVYDFDDPFLSLIISNADKILSTNHLRRLVERYLRLLALFFASQLRTGGSVFSLIIAEKSLFEAICPNGQYVPILKRAGKLTQIYWMIRTKAWL